MQSVDFFNQAIAKDPNYALAWLGLGDAWSTSTAYGADENVAYPKSNAAARKALELDPTLAHAHAILGANYFEKEWDFAGGEAEMRKAIELDPNDATAHQWFGEDLAQMGGREEEAIAQADRAHQLDPGSLIITTQTGTVRVWSHKYDEGLDICKKVVLENPGFARGHECMAQAYEGKKMYPEAILEYGKDAELSNIPGWMDTLNITEKGFREGGWKTAMAQLAALMTARRQKGEPISSTDIAAFYAASGSKEEALRWLDTAFHEHDHELIRLKTLPRLESLHDDPRFAELARKVGLP
jgi:tetratricopeptide (TPR) repeat protein